MSKKKIIAVIPARMASSRFPGKPLVKILDLPMIEHVRRRVHLCDSVDEVYVATCDQEIRKAVEEYGGKAIMTASTHQRCTDRVEEAARQLKADIIIIFQGDEPLFYPDVANKLVKPMLNDENVLCVNLLSTIRADTDLQDPNIIKTILNNRDYVIYFSRAAIPYSRADHACPAYRQTGISAFKKRFLDVFSSLTQTPLEIIESIDFLRIIEHGYPILGVIYEQNMLGVDEPEHVAKIEKILKEDQYQHELYQKILKI